LRAAAAALASLLAAGPALAEETFDLSAYEKKPLEWKGYFELRPERQFLNRDGAGYLLQFPNGTRSSADRWSAAAELSGILRHDNLSFSFTGHATYLEDVKGSEGDARFYEAYGRWQPDPGVSVDLGKRALGWGKGYAWNAVAFFDRAKDPTDPELAREGFVMATGALVRSFTDGPVQTLALTPVLLPTTADLNDNFGAPGHWNPAVKLYGLVRDTDVDFIYAARGSHGPRVGLDFSRNLGVNLEVHGEWAHTRDMPRTVLTAGNTLASETRDFTSWLLGLRYLTERDTTWIAEVYHNGAGYTEAEMNRFFALAHAASANPALRPLAGQAAAQGYTQPNAMRDYVYLRVSQKEPFDILYFTPSITLIQNLDDDSRSLSPELLYTGITNLELRLRLFFLSGGRLSDFGEKQNDRRVELRVRYYF
jgi:hypothetical protein